MRDLNRGCTGGVGLIGYGVWNTLGNSTNISRFDHALITWLAAHEGMFPGSLDINRPGRMGGCLPYSRCSFISQPCINSLSISRSLALSLSLLYTLGRGPFGVFSHPSFSRTLHALLPQLVSSPSRIPSHPRVLTAGGAAAAAATGSVIPLGSNALGVNKSPAAISETPKERSQRIAPAGF